MNSAPAPGGRRGVVLAAAATVLLVALGATLLVLGLDRGDRPTAPPVGAAGTAAARSDASPSQGERNAVDPRSEAGPGPSRRDRARFGSFLPGSPPVSLDIPSIDVHSSNIVDLGLQDDGSIEVPQDASAPGWFAPGPAPGQLGPAVIAGHVDSDTGPAVFYRLGQLGPGDRVTVTRADGTVATFSVDRVVTYEKDEFPTSDVYGATTRAELRLITCSGDYDDETGYDSNTVAYAHLV